MRWQKKLTKKELKHVRKWVGNTLTAIKAQAVIHAGWRKDKPENPEPCYTCYIIAGKLGLKT